MGVDGQKKIHGWVGNSRLSSLGMLKRIGTARRSPKRAVYVAHDVYDITAL